MSETLHHKHRPQQPKRPASASRDTIARRLSRRAALVAAAGQLAPAEACFRPLPPKFDLPGYYQEMHL